MHIQACVCLCTVCRYDIMPFTTSIATKSAPYTRLITTSALALQSQRRGVHPSALHVAARGRPLGLVPQQPQLPTVPAAIAFHHVHRPLAVSSADAAGRQNPEATAAGHNLGL